MHCTNLTHSVGHFGGTDHGMKTGCLIPVPDVLGRGGGGGAALVSESV